MSNNIIALPKGFTIINLDIHTWSGKRKLSLNDLDIKGVISKEIASLGSLNAFDPEVIAKFKNLSNKAHAACSKFGTRLGGGYIFPETKLNWLNDTLLGIKTEYYETKYNLLQRYENDFEEWCTRAEVYRKGFSHVIKKQAYTKEYIDHQIQFGWSGLQSKINAAGNSLLDALAEKALAKILYLEGKVNSTTVLKLSRKDMRFFLSIRNKLRANLTLEKRIAPLLAEVDKLFKLIGEDSKEDIPKEFIPSYMKTLTLMAHPTSLYGEIEPSLNSEVNANEDVMSLVNICELF